MQVFVIINYFGTIINADVNVKSWLAKEYVAEDLLEILVIANVNVINHVMFEREYLDYENCKKDLVDKLVEECSENIDGN